MKVEAVIWDEEDDKGGNYWHIAVEGHGVSRVEVDDILLDENNPTEVSRTSGNRITFGWAADGRRLAVVWEPAVEDPLTAYPLSAYEVPPPRRKRRRRR
jgi:YD repeat-containing protein